MNLPSGSEVRQHAADYAKLIPEFRHPNIAATHCIEATEGFSQYLHDRGISYGAGPYEQHFGPLVNKNCHSSGWCRDEDHAHSYTRVKTRDEGELAIDHSARQIHPNMAFPHIAPAAEYKKFVAETGPYRDHQAPHHFASFIPTKRVFTHTCGLDHRLFDENAHLRPDVRRYIMSTMALWWSQSYEKWSAWSQVYFAGSEASEWTSDTLEGNNDFDVLVGVEYDGFRKANPTYQDWTNQQITDAMNLGFRQHNGPTMIVVDGTTYGPFDRTTYVNPDSYDIRNIKPYAAYNVSEDKWAVRPPHLPHWSLSELPRAVQRVLKACDRLANDILKLPEPERTQQGAALFDAWHSDRSRAFGPNGEGWYDIANLREKWLDQEGIWAEIVNCKHRFNEGLGAALPGWSNTPQGYTAGARGDLPEGLMFEHHNVGVNQQIVAHHPDMNETAGHITWWNDDGEVTDINVHPSLHRRGLATELWRRAKELQPNLKHSDNQTEMGKLWTPHISSKTTETLEEIGRREHPNIDHYMSGGIGHLQGDESRSVVGFMPTQFMKRYREHSGDWNGDHSEEVVHRIRKDIRDGKGIHTPLMIHYSDDDKWGYLGEGNHRLRAADEEGSQTVPVRVVRGGPVGEKKRRGIGAPMDLGGKFNEDHNGRVYPYVPSDIHPYHFLKESYRQTTPHDLYGSNDVDEFFGDRLTSPTPFQPAGRVKSHKDYDESLVARSITHPHEFPIEDVDPRELRSTQTSVTKDGVSHYMRGGSEYGKQNGDHRLGNDVPRIYHREDGQKLILSGHHRATAALLKGEPLKAIVIKGPWGGPRSKVAVHINEYKHDPDRIWYQGRSKNRPDPFTTSHPGTGQSGDWNSLIGHHFSSEKDVAQSFGQHVYHVNLHLQNPKVYSSEVAMDNEVMQHEHEAGNHYTRHLDPSFEHLSAGNAKSGWKADKALRSENHSVAEDNSHFWLSSHPDKRGIVSRFKQRLLDAGHDGIVYGNDFEKPGHASAIALHPEKIEIYN